ncbi:MAG: PKD domain-containing protein [Rhizobacter sp.]|nr:PKD domain-containing protein [Ferruginibacter sp.]
MEFVENKGQWHPNVKYKANFSTGAFFLEEKGFSVVLHHPDDIRMVSQISHGHKQADAGKQVSLPTPADGKFSVRSFGYKVRLLGAAVNAKQIPDKPANSHNNYFLGNDPNKWASDCKIFGAVTYQEVYPNIDVRYYSDGGKLKYDFIVKPGGNPDYIALEYVGPQSITLKDKELVIGTSVGDVRELYPYTYQSGTGKNLEVDCRYVVKGNVVSFKVGKYDPAATLVIDPSIVFCSFTGSEPDNWGYAATPGPDGSLFAGGIAFGSRYPTSSGALDASYGGGPAEGPSPTGYDIAIFKFSPNGRLRVYATYLGGRGNEQPHSMISDAQGNLVIAGRSASDDYPLTAPLFGEGGKYDIVITKLNATGSQMIGSVKIGGKENDGVNIQPKYPELNPNAISLRRNYGDDARSEVILDASNNIILASATQSGDFYIRNAVQDTWGGRQDGVIIKFDPNLANPPLFSTYFGGNQNDACFVGSINPVTGDLYIGGATESSNLPGNKTGVIGPAFNTSTVLSADGFVTQLRPDGSAIVKTSYLGTTGIDLVYGLKFDKFGFPYVMGTTTGNWPWVNATFRNPDTKQFISKLQPDLSAFVYSTTFGAGTASPNLSPIAFLVDRCENVYVSGWGGGLNVSQQYSNGNTNGLPEVNPLVGIPRADGADFYFFVLERNANSQLFGSHFGQNGGLGDHVDGGTSRFDANGVIYQAICANCNGGAVFPTTANVWSEDNGSTSCNEAVVKIEMNFAGVGAAIQTAIGTTKNDTTGCIPLYVKFSDTLRKGKRFIWNFGDGSPEISTTLPDTAHTFTAVGTYIVRLIAEDSSTCNIRDTAYVTIIAGNNKANLGFTFTKLPPCQSLTMQYTNTSTPTFGSFGPASFVWDYGDGSPKDTAGLNPPRVHTYAAPGTYLVTLKIIDPIFCNTPDTIIREVRINPLVKAQFTTPALGCAPYNAVFNNTSLAGTDFIWEFGDGTTSTDVHPTHLYLNPGSYDVRLIAIDLTTCNLRDTSAFFRIRVEAKPTAFFTWGPNPPIENTPVQFTNGSTGANTYLWNFGDGESSTLTNPSHQYNATDTFNVELIAYTTAGCTDTFNLDVYVIIVPLLDVPNAFTPAQTGRNSVVKVEGFGIGKMQWRIYNRQGLMVFESASQKVGWNGTYKGKLQPIDVYVYTLDVEFTDGKKLRKTGDITLLR